HPAHRRPVHPQTTMPLTAHPPPHSPGLGRPDHRRVHPDPGHPRPRLTRPPALTQRPDAPRRPRPPPRKTPGHHPYPPNYIYQLSMSTRSVRPPHAKRERSKLDTLDKDNRSDHDHKHADNKPDAGDPASSDNFGVPRMPPHGRVAR